MRPIALVFALAVLMGGCTAAEQGTKSEAAEAGSTTPAAPRARSGEPGSNTSGITVTGVGTAESSPDVVVARLGVEVRQPAVDEAVDGATTAAEDLIAALQDAGVATEAIQTIEVSVRPQLEPPPPPPPDADAPVPPQDRIVGYVARNLVGAEITDLDAAGDILQAAVDAAGDAARIESVRFDVRGDSAVREQARDEAFADAREAAEQYAGLADVDLGGVVEVVEGAGGVGPPRPAADVAVEDAAGIPVEPGQSTTTVTVTVTWALG